MKILVTGGVRSGKSRHAESLLSEHRDVTYVAVGPTMAEEPDADWADRIARHRASRPSSWTTLETRDLAAALTRPGPVLVDCLGTWLTGFLDASLLWDQDADTVLRAVGTQVDEVVARLGARTDPVVLVTNEVGLGVVPAHRSGRLFRDLLGTVNQRIGTACDEVHLVVAGRTLVL